MRRGAVVAAFVGVVIAGAAIGIATRSSEPEPPTDSTDTIVMLGDSITRGGNWIQLFPDRVVVNAGYIGITTEGLIPIAGEVARSRPSAVFILAGINDIFADRPPAWTVDHLLDIVTAIESEAPDARIVIQTVLPNAERRDDVLATNAAIRVAAIENGLEVLDLYPEFDDGGGALRPAETYDGTHLTVPGYERWAALLEPQFERLDQPAEPG